MEDVNLVAYEISKKPGILQKYDWSTADWHQLRLLIIQQRLLWKYVTNRDLRILNRYRRNGSI